MMNLESEVRWQVLGILTITKQNGSASPVQYATVAHNCHGKLKFTTANLKFTSANSNSPRQIQIHDSEFKIHRGKFKFTMAKIQIHRVKFKFTTASSNSPQQIQRVCLLFVLLQELGLSSGWVGSGSAC